MQDVIAVARGEKPVDLLVTNARLINTLSGEIHAADIGVYQGQIIGFGPYKAQEILDVGNRFICPGLIEGHIHIESSLLSPDEFVHVVAQHGTCAVVCDPHEIANVYGKEGIAFFLRTTEDCPVSVFIMVPSCVPATELETSGGEISAQDIKELLSSFPERVLGLAEMMNFPGVLSCDETVMHKLDIARRTRIDGHCPGLRGQDLNAYILAGPGSDHESSLLEEAREKLRKGMHLMIREGSSAKNLKDLVPLFRDTCSSNISFVTDDCHADDLVSKGHLDHALRLAMRHGVDPIRAIQAATIHTARYFGLRTRGAIAPGFKADFLVVSELSSFAIDAVYLNGQLYSGKSLSAQSLPAFPSSMNMEPMRESAFAIPCSGDSRYKVRAIEIIPGQILTRKKLVSCSFKDGLASPDPDQDLAKLAVIERHHRTGNIGLGFVTGLGLSCGAIASTVAHDSHNLIVAGKDDRDMCLAAMTVKEIGGGFAVIKDGAVLSQLPLPLGGLMSMAPVQEVVSELKGINEAVLELGCPRDMNVFMHLSFVALPVIPEIRLTDRGLVDVNTFAFIDLWE